MSITEYEIKSPLLAMKEIRDVMEYDTLTFPQFWGLLNQILRSGNLPAMPLREAASWWCMVVRDRSWQG